MVGREKGLEESVRRWSRAHTNMSNCGLEIIRGCRSFSERSETLKA